MNYDLAWLQNWANAQNYTGDDGAMSWLVISQVIPNFPNHAVHLGKVDENTYQVTLTGPVIDGTPVYITRK